MLPVVNPLTAKALFKASFHGYYISFARIFWVLLGYIAFVLVTNSLHACLLWILEENLNTQLHPHWFNFAAIWTIILLAFIHAFVGVWLHLLIFIRINAILTHSLSPKRLLFETSLRQFLPYFASSFILFCLVSFGLLLFILPGLFVWLSFILVKPIIATENLKLLTAFSRSVELVRNHYFHVFYSGFLVMLVGGIIAFLMVGSVGIVFFLLDRLISHGNLNEVCLLIGLFIIAYIGFALLLPLYYSFLSVLTQDLKARHAINDETVMD